MRVLTTLVLSLFFIPSINGQNAQTYADLTYEELDSLMSNGYRQGKYNYVIPLAQALIDKAQKDKNDTLVAEGLSYLGAMHLRMGDYGKALPVMLRVKSLDEKMIGKEHPDYTISLNNLAVLYWKMGNYDKALPLYFQAKNIREKVLGKEHPSYARSLNNLAVILQEMGNYSQALPLKLQTLDIYEKAYGKENRDYALSLSNLAGLYMAIEKYDKALPLYLQVKDIRQRILGEKHPDYAVILNNLATLYSRMGSYDKALPLALQVKDIREEALGKSHFLYAQSYNNLATLQESMGNYDKALSLFLHSASLYEKTLDKGHPDYIKFLNNLAGLHVNMGNYNDAWEVLFKAMNATVGTQIITDFDGNWSGRFKMAVYPSNVHLEEMMKSLGKVYELLEKDTSVADVLEKQTAVADLADMLLVKARDRVTNEKDKLRILSLSNDWLQKNLKVLTPEIHADKAFNLSDKNKSVLLLQATKSALAYRMGKLPDSLIWQDRKLHKTQSELTAKLLEKQPKGEADELRNQLNEVNQDIDEFIGMIEKEYPKYYKAKYQSVNAKVTDVQALLDLNTALLEYVIADSVVHIFCVDKEKVQWSKSYVSNEELQNRIKKLHLSLSDYSSKQSYREFTSNAHWFYKHLVAPVLEGKPNISNLIIATDGELGHLPFETFLVDEASNQREDYRNLHYMLNDYNISYNYSATLWKENVEAPAPKNNGQILGVAANYDILLDSSLIAERLPTDQWTRAEISPLPGAREEVKVLQEKYEGFFAFDTLASERTVKAMASDFSILHFATHGILDKEQSILSSLAFTEDNDSTESNFWQAHEISKSQLNADLVVLSACETGYGKFETGNGIASLARAFMYAGAPSLVVSLWQVRDVTTSKLMKSFYDNLDSGMKKDEALRQAKIQHIQSADEVFVHPSYWAPFIMMGKTDAVDIKRKNNLTAWKISIGLMVLLVVSGYIFRKKVSQFI